MANRIKTAFGKFLHRLSGGMKASGSAVGTSTAGAGIPDGKDVDDETLAAISAAISMVMENRPFIVTSVASTVDEFSRWKRATAQFPPTPVQKRCQQ
jgi:hypothetical protein